MIPLRLLAICILLISAAFAQSAQITVFAAASLTDALTRIASQYEQETGDKIVFNFGASGTLARQIEAGAPADLFLSADSAKMEPLIKKNLLDPKSLVNLLSNALVVVVPSDRPAPNSPQALKNSAFQRIALGDPSYVPAGTYAKTYLEKLAAWSAVERKIIPCESVRAVLATVASGEADAGFVYKTDAAISSKVRVAFEVPARELPKIEYPAAQVRESKAPEAAAKFLAYLTAEKASKVFREFGFVVPVTGPSK